MHLRIKSFNKSWDSSAIHFIYLVEFNTEKFHWNHFEKVFLIIFHIEWSFISSSKYVSFVTFENLIMMGSEFHIDKYQSKYTLDIPFITVDYLTPLSLWTICKMMDWLEQHGRQSASLNDYSWQFQKVTSWPDEKIIVWNKTLFAQSSETSSEN